MSINKDSQKAPNLRFKGFTDDWEQRKLGEYTKYRRGSFPQPYGNKEWYGGENAMPFVQVVDVSNNLKLEPKTKQNISSIAQPKSVFVSSGTVVVTLQGSIGRVAITQYDSYVDRTLLIFEDYVRKTDKYFWGYTIQNKFNIEKEKAPGGTIKTITKAALSQFVVSIPLYDEQSKIGTFLKNIDKTITLHQRKLEQLNQLKEAFLQQMFPGKGETVPKLRFAGFEGDWEERKFDEFLEEFIRKSKIENEFTTLSSTNSGMEVREGRVSGDTNIGYKIIENDDLVLSPQNLWLGNINLNYIGTGLVSPSYKTFKIKNLSSSFLKPQLRSKRLLNQYELASTQGASVVRRNLDMELFYQITLPVPVMQEQYKIGKLFKDLDDYIVLQSQKVNKLKSMKELLLQNMFI